MKEITRQDLTMLEQKVLLALSDDDFYIEAICNKYNEEDSVTIWTGVEESMKESNNVIRGVLSSLVKKGLLYIDSEEEIVGINNHCQKLIAMEKLLYDSNHNQ